MLLLIPQTVWAGAVSTLGIMGGAILMHLTKLGIEVNGDSGVLFYTAIITFILSLSILWMHRKDIPFLFKSKD